MNNDVPNIKPDWQPLADRLSVLLSREIISGQKYQSEDEREFWVNSGGRTTIESVALPPYTEDDLAAIDFEWTGLPTSSPLWLASQWVICRDDSYNTYLLRVGVELDAEKGHRVCVRWPTAWPANSRGRGDLHCSSAWHDIRAVDVPDGWNVRVWAMNLNECVLGLRGLIDIDGEFILSCEYEHISTAEGLLTTLSKTTAEPLPEGRTTHWMWAEVSKPDEPFKDSYGRDVCDVVEVWSGKRVNPVGTKALRNSFSHGYFQITPDSSHSNLTAGSEVGLMLASLSKPAPLLWKKILGDVPFGALAAQCINTGLYGYVGATGQTVVEPQFVSAIKFTDDWSVVEIDGGKKGAIAIDFEATRVNHFSAHMTTLPWRWLLQPVWDDIADEYDGHFTVQNIEKEWGMITPFGKPVSPFELRENYSSINDIHGVCRLQFKRLQQQRFLALLMDITSQPKDQRSLKTMRGFLFSSWGKYDYGSLTSNTFEVSARYDVMGAGLFKQQDFSYKTLPYEFKAGTKLSWQPSERIYANSVDLSTHAAVFLTDRTEMYASYVPWEALDLVLSDTFEEDFQSQGSVALRVQIASTHTLYAALNTLGLWLENHRFIHKNQDFNALSTNFISFAAFPKNANRYDYWDAEDASRAVLFLAQALQYELWGLILKDKKERDNDFFSSSLDHALKEADIPSLFDSKRYQADTTLADERFRQTPMWIGADVSPSAIEPDHPWVLEMQVLRDSMVTAYEAFKTTPLSYIMAKVPF